MVLDHRWRGELVAVIDGNGPDSGPPVEPLLEVVDVAATAARGALGVEALGMVVATVRAGHGLRAGDADAWCAMSRRAEHHGLTLIEWFVIGPGGIHCPRDVAGEPARWPP